MSFQDIESGSLELKSSSTRQDSSHGVVAGVFRINTAVSSFKRLVNMLGTHRDTLALREKLHAVEQQISQLVEETVTRMKDVSLNDHQSSTSTDKKLADAKLAKDFQAVLKEFQSAQKVAQQQERANSLIVPKSIPLSQYSKKDLGTDQEDIKEQQVALLDYTQYTAQTENQALFNVAVIEEREQGIREIQQQIGEVSEIFKDLARIVETQGYIIDDIDSNVESSVSATIQATVQLEKASKSAKSVAHWKCVILVIFGTALLGFVIVMAA